MQGDYSGDAVVVADSPKGMPAIGGYVAWNRGLNASDCTVPVLLSGPYTKFNDLPEIIWLRTLHSEVLGIDPIDTRRAER